MRITSIRERPEYIPALLTSLEEHWPACMPWIKKHMEEVLRTGGPLPDAYVAVEKGKVVGGYTLAYKEILWSTDTGLWIATLYVDPGFRGKHLSPILIDHARRRGWELGRRRSTWPPNTPITTRSLASIPSAQTPAPGANPPRCLRRTPCPPRVGRPPDVSQTPYNQTAPWPIWARGHSVCREGVQGFSL